MRKPHGPDRRLYWTPLSVYRDCPQQYLWSYGWEGIDVGGGEGLPKPKPILESDGYSLMGDVIQFAIERLYKDKLYADPQVASKLIALVERDYLKRLEGAYVDWTRMGSPEDLLNICKEGVIGFLKTMKHNKLLGQYNGTEVPYKGVVEGFGLGGKADLVITRKDTGTAIYDGKNSLSKGKYTDPDQLRWYALLMYLQYGKMPDSLAFLYYRYPYGHPEGGDGTDPVDFNQQDLARLTDLAVSSKKSMIAHQFDPTPKPPVCRLCAYETVCDARRVQKEANKRKRGVTTLTPQYGQTDESF